MKVWYNILKQAERKSVMDCVKEVIETGVDLNTALELLKAYDVEYQDWQSYLTQI